MKKFFVINTGDGMKHLFLDDTSESDLIKVAETKDCFFVKEGSHVVIVTEGKNDNRFLGIENDKLFEIVVPRYAQFEIINGICCYWFEKDYYAILLDETGEAVIKCLGKRSTVFLGKEAVKFYQMTTWDYFKQDNGYISFAINKKIISLKEPYCEVEHYPELGRIACTKIGDYYDIYFPYSDVPIKGDSVSVCEIPEQKHVFVWDKTKQAWSLYRSSYLWGKNAMINVCNELIFLYEVTAKGLSLVAKGFFYVGKNYVCIDGMYYFLTSQGEVDFNPVTTIKAYWRRLKGFFKAR